MPKRPVVVVWAVWLALGPGLVAAQSTEPDLAAGIRQVEDGDYSAAVITLDRVARALETRKDRAHELARAYLYLGIAYVGLGSETSARARFRDALTQSRDLRLDPEQFPPKVIELFEKAREENRVPAPTAASPAPTSAPASGGKKKSKTPLILIGLGGAAAAGVAVAAGGGGGGTASTSATVPRHRARRQQDGDVQRIRQRRLQQRHRHLSLRAQCGGDARGHAGLDRSRPSDHDAPGRHRSVGSRYARTLLPLFEHERADVRGRAEQDLLRVRGAGRWRALRDVHAHPDLPAVGGQRRSARISRAALAAGPPVTPPPGWVPAPHM